MKAYIKPDTEVIKIELQGRVAYSMPMSNGSSNNNQFSRDEEDMDIWGDEEY